MAQRSYFTGEGMEVMDFGKCRGDWADDLLLHPGFSWVRLGGVIGIPESILFFSSLRGTMLLL